MSLKFSVENILKIPTINKYISKSPISINNTAKCFKQAQLDSWALAVAASKLILSTNSSHINEIPTTSFSNILLKDKKISFDKLPNINGKNTRRTNKCLKRNNNNSENDFHCNICNKSFTAHYNLTRHMPVHTGARPFTCKVY